MISRQDGVEAIRAGMRKDLVIALKARATETAAALRTAIAALDNAEAVDASEIPAASQDGPVAGASVGLGSSEVARRSLSAADARSVVGAVIAEYLDEAQGYESMGRGEDAQRLRRQAETLRSHLPSQLG